MTNEQERALASEGDEEDEEQRRTNSRKEDLMEALRECRDDIKVFALNDKFAYLSIIDDTLSDDYLDKVANLAYNLIRQNLDSLLRDSTDLKRLL